jgi:hypothetical protein
MLQRLCLLLSLLYLAGSLIAQDYYYEDFVYVESIKSVKLNKYGNPVDPPIVRLGSTEKIMLSFDDLDAVDKRYTYRIIHCNRNWQPSEIDELEYLDGFNGEEIRDSYHSVSTKVDYVHYDLVLPNEYLKWTISGNFLLIVYDEEDYPVITKRFLVVNPKISIGADFINPKKTSLLKTHQSLDITVSHEDYYIRDPLNEVTVTVLQNFKWFDAIYNRKPKNNIGSTLSFDPFEPFTFPAHKNFRNFDIRSLTYTSRYVYSIKANQYRIDVLLEKDRKRTYSNFISENDSGGNFVPGNSDSQFGIRAAEYVNVGFTLESPLELEQNDVYIIGGFSDWQLYDSNRMDYLEDSGYYSADLLLKQGYYDYLYALVDRDGQIDLSALEGDWYETDNTYYVLVYLREFGSYYDELVGMTVLLSR